MTELREDLEDDFETIREYVLQNHIVQPAIDRIESELKLVVAMGPSPEQVVLWLLYEKLVEALNRDDGYEVQRLVQRIGEAKQ